MSILSIETTYEGSGWGILI